MYIDATCTCSRHDTHNDNDGKYNIYFSMTHTLEVVEPFSSVFWQKLSGCPLQTLPENDHSDKIRQDETTEREANTAVRHGGTRRDKTSQYMHTARTISAAAVVLLGLSQFQMG